MEHLKAFLEYHRSDNTDLIYDIYDKRNDIKNEILWDFRNKLNEYNEKNNLPKNEDGTWDYGDVGYDYISGFKARQEWKLIPLETFQNVWNRFVTTPKSLDIPNATINTFKKIVATITDNVLKADINTELTGHKEFSVLDPDDLEDNNLTEEEMEEFYGEYCTDDRTGQLRISDYAMTKLMNKLVEILSEDDLRKKFMRVDELLEIIHHRSDIAHWFVEGGSHALSQLSGFLRDEDWEEEERPQSKPKETEPERPKPKPKVKRWKEWQKPFESKKEE